MKMNQKGRSMVEMLSVLAIIGVLSAGAMAGYSKAMFRHKVNQTIDIFQGVLQRFSELEQKDVGQIEINSAEKIISYGLLPNCQKVEGEEGGSYSYCQLPIGVFGMDIDAGAGFVGEFWIDFTDSKSCIAFASAGWEKTVPVEWFFPQGHLDYGTTTVYDPSGTSGEVIDRVDMSKVVEGCSHSIMSEKNDFLMYLVVRHEI